VICKQMVSAWAVAKAIVEAHGGKISVRSVVDKGTTVDIRLPKPNGE